MRAVSPRGVEGTGVRASQPSPTRGVGLWSRGLAFTSMGDTSSSTMQTQERHFQSLHLKATIHHQAENKAVTEMPGFPKQFCKRQKHLERPTCWPFKTRVSSGNPFSELILRPEGFLPLQARSSETQHPALPHACARQKV